MLFNSIHFLLFFPVFVILFFSLPYRYRKPLLLIASYYFYLSWKVEYGLLLLTSTAVDFFAALRIEKSNTQRERKQYLLLSLFVNLAFLFSFKYLAFVTENIIGILDAFGMQTTSSFSSILLPIGISFYTFQSISYTIDVYRGETKAERNFSDFALFVSFFPQLVAGPIERFSHLRPQFERKVNLSADRFSIGLKLIFWGFFQKIVIADSMAPFVEAVYTTPANYNGLTIVLATIFFSIQIYCDFAGYTDIARGVAKIIGIDLVKNFHRPYFSFSFIDFWRRWHMSLFEWFKNYIYISLGGNKKGKLIQFRNIFAVFLVSGIWHGANWTFIVWGIINGLFYMTEVYLNQRYHISKLEKSKFYLPERLLRSLIVFIAINFTWIFFRANSIEDVPIIFGQLFYHFGTIPAFGKIGMTVNFILIAILMAAHWYDRDARLVYRTLQLPVWARWSIYFLLGILFLGLGNFGSQQFIYFQF